MRVPYKKSTVHDVALRAGVSQSAVSHFINGRVNVCSPETAERINQAIKELHFTPSRALRHQRSQATNTIGICVSLPSEDETSSSATFLHRFWTGVSRVVDEHSYRIIHYPRSLRNSTSCNPFLDGSIDGILISLGLEDQRIETLSDAGLPAVVVNRSEALPPKVGSVVLNERDIVDTAVRHLVELGHARIGYFGPSARPGRKIGMRPTEKNEPAQKRYGHYADWMRRLGQSEDDFTFFTFNYDYIPVDEAVAAVDYWTSLAAPPTALFCANDRLAISAVRAFQARGLRVPDDISVIGIDNEGAAEKFEPGVTSVETPIHEIGSQATALLLDIVNGRAEPEAIQIPVSKIVARASTAPPKA